MEFMARLLSCVSIYPAKPGSEEYLDSEKYEIKSWDLNQSRQSTGILLL